ncbi:MAG: HAD hydrolase-like protein, partial [Betaproteobacteria bacterium]|nr:HAD hydrolase-like protein [Betaproteobacteria bacterium]
MKRVVCAFDLDNTLYDFVGFFGPAFRGMMAAISKKTAIPVDDLHAAAREVFQRRGFLEYAYLVREMSVFSAMDESEIASLEKLASGVFGRVRKKRLKTYSGIEETLRELHAGGIILAAVTNAPLYQAYRRLGSLRLIG